MLLYWIYNTLKTLNIKIERKNIKNNCWLNIDKSTQQIWSVRTRLHGRILTLVGLLRQTLLLQIGLLERTLFLQTGLPEQILLALTDFVGWTLVALMELLEQALLTLIVLLGKTSLNSNRFS